MTETSATTPRPFPYQFVTDIFHIFFKREEENGDKTDAELQRLTVGLIFPLFTLPFRGHFHAGLERARVALIEKSVAYNLDLDLNAESNRTLFLDGGLDFYLVGRDPYPHIFTTNDVDMIVYGQLEGSIWPKTFEDYTILMGKGDNQADFTDYSEDLIDDAHYSLFRWGIGIAAQYSGWQRLHPFVSLGYSQLRSSLTLTYTEKGNEFLDTKNVVNDELKEGEFSFDEEFLMVVLGLEFPLGEGGALMLRLTQMEDDETSVTSALVSTRIFLGPP